MAETSNKESRDAELPSYPSFSAPAATTAASPSAPVQVHEALVDNAGEGSENPIESVATPLRTKKVTFSSDSSFGIGLVQKGDHVVVSSVESWSAAAAAGPLGAKIKAVNETSCAGKSKDEILVMLVDAKHAGRQLMLTFEMPLSRINSGQI